MTRGPGVPDAGFGLGFCTVCAIALEGKECQQVLRTLTELAAFLNITAQTRGADRTLVRVLLILESVFVPCTSLLLVAPFLLLTLSSEWENGIYYCIQMMISSDIFPFLRQEKSIYALMTF